MSRIPLLLCLLALIACGAPADPEPTPLPPLEVVEAPRYTVERGRIEETLRFAGRTTATVEEPLFFAVDGTVTELFVTAGSAVAEGEAVASLAVGVLEGQLEEAQLALRAAEARQRAAAQATADALAEAQRALIEAELRYQQAQLATNEGEIAAAEVALAAATGAAARRVAEAQLTDARNRAAAQALTVDLLAADISAIEAQIERLERADADQPDIDIEQAQLTIRQLEQAIADRTLTAPFAGTLLTLAVRPGDDVEAFDPIALVADMRELDISADLGFEEINRLSVGQAVHLTLANRDGPFAGAISRLPGFGTTDSRVRVTLAAPPADLRPGELAEMTVLLAAADDALLLPEAAVRDFQGRTFVVVEQADGTRRRADVRLGISDGERVEIVSGVALGQVVIGQ